MTCPPIFLRRMYLQIPKQEKTPRGQKLARCFEDHAKAVGQDRRKIENTNEEVPALHEDLAELVAYRLDDEQADVSVERLIAPAHYYVRIGKRNTSKHSHAPNTPQVFFLGEKNKTQKRASSLSSRKREYTGSTTPRPDMPGAIGPDSHRPAPGLAQADGP